MIEKYSQGSQPLTLKVFLGGLPPEWNEAIVTRFVQQFGLVREVEIKRDVEGRSKRFGFTTLDCMVPPEHLYGKHQFEQTVIEVKELQQRFLYLSTSDRHRLTERDMGLGLSALGYDIENVELGNRQMPGSMLFKATFATEESVKSLLGQRFIQVNRCTVECLEGGEKKSKPIAHQTKYQNQRNKQYNRIPNHYQLTSGSHMMGRPHGREPEHQPYYYHYQPQPEVIPRQRTPKPQPAAFNVSASQTFSQAHELDGRESSDFEDGDLEEPVEIQKEQVKDPEPKTGTEPTTLVKVNASSEVKIEPEVKSRPNSTQSSDNQSQKDLKALLTPAPVAPTANPYRKKSFNKGQGLEFHPTQTVEVTAEESTVRSNTKKLSHASSDWHVSTSGVYTPVYPYLPTFGGLAAFPLTGDWTDQPTPIPFRKEMLVEYYTFPGRI